ncbi:GAMM1 protein [Amylocystis lapponica]|nr:GAMM1 protein [Amylocystis lapponica]
MSSPDVPNPPSKKLKMEPKVGHRTHNGTFHCDEALAVFLLKKTKAYADADLKRTRDPAVLDTCSIVVDVGGVYDEDKQRFDHHQRGFGEVFGHGFTTKLSSAGLVYKHFGKEIIAKRLNRALDAPKLYKEFIEAIDGIDNGAKFLKASSLVGGEFVDRLDYYANAWLPARELVAAELTKRMLVDPSGKIMLLEQFLPWKEHLFELETEFAIPSDVKPVYVLYADETGNNWRVQAVPISPESFESRKPLPEVWRGLRDDNLGIFVHASGFIGGNKTKEGALKLAKLALAM